MKYDSVFCLWAIFITFFSLASVIHSGPIPDTGQQTSYTDVFGEDSDYLINPQHFTKLDKTANTLNSNAEAWVMVRDETTGLIWEIKQTNNSIQDKSRQFLWYDPDNTTNGGDSGTNSDGSDTNDYIRTLNNQALGGFKDWRLPDIYELATLLNMNQNANGILSEYFPNTMQGGYWTSSTYAGSAQKAWYISFVTGKNVYDKKPK
ncbi:MAG: hypothetical protein OMM_01282 [Candidatus Magnetoglobus multicellularis str. Araruama]|uniref:Lcl C-terminal domain-containing protein n=1 Tax=Candidatus Magnetoglobus multicellularis str. Araruama TaxID=890399 RepID=A0A1V1PDM8_9BACT|nr:MAG: hypothetical protein OMM_01282 [Candidatus Magnetoglobus multicellularis str. Araruama]